MAKFSRSAGIDGGAISGAPLPPAQVLTSPANGEAPPLRERDGSGLAEPLFDAVALLGAIESHLDYLEQTGQLGDEQSSNLQRLLGMARAQIGPVASELCAVKAVVR